LFDQTKGSIKKPSQGPLHEPKQKLSNQFIDFKRFVARPDKSLSTTIRTLCQEFFRQLSLAHDMSIELTHEVSDLSGRVRGMQDAVMQQMTRAAMPHSEF
jgi:hypothetical protein